MADFANKASPELALNWKKADQTFKEFSIGSNKVGAKSLIKKGDSTPEVVDQLLFSKKNSDLDFLVKNLDKEGMKAAGQRILQRMLEKSSKTGEINPNTFQSEMTKSRNQMFKFFDADQRKAIVAIRDALKQTRRAQDASVSTPTGQGVIPLFALANPKLLLMGGLQAIIERPKIRNLIIKRKAAKSVKARNKIDKELQSEIDKLQLAGALAPTALEGEQ
jgi:hypothetical protein